MTDPRPRFTENRANFRLTFQQSCLAEIFGWDAGSLAQHALRVYIEGVVKEWYNIETFAVVHEIRCNPEWEELCYQADDYLELVDLLEKKDINRTRSGITIRNKKLARKRINIEIRKRNRFNDEAEK